MSSAAAIFARRGCRRNIVAHSESPEAYAIVEVATGKLADSQNGDSAALPGSTIKPFLPRTPALFPCRRTLRIGEHRLDCTHPVVYGPLGEADALVLSCNCYYAALALRLPPADVRRALGEFDAQLAATPEQRQLQVLGYWGVSATPLRLARAYRRLLLSGPPPGFIGKTGTTKGAAWYAGWAPAENPRFVAAVMTGGRGITDAEPAARKLFAKWLR
jgi:hypothetical protein